MFADRQDAGRRLATLLGAYRDRPDVVVLGVPRGGVVVAAEVAEALDAPLGVVVTAKVGAPGYTEYAIGAVSADGEVFANPQARYTPEEVRSYAGPALAKVRQELNRFRPGIEAGRLEGKTVLLVDDGIATGLTARAAIAFLRRKGAARLVLAVPVMPPDTFRQLTPLVDETVVVDVPDQFAAVGQFYRMFGQTEDAEVVDLLARFGRSSHDEREERGLR